MSARTDSMSPSRASTMATRASRTGRANASTSARAPEVCRLTTLATLLWISSPPGTPETAGIRRASNGSAAFDLPEGGSEVGFGPHPGLVMEHSPGVDGSCPLPARAGRTRSGGAPRLCLKLRHEGVDVGHLHVSFHGRMVLLGALPPCAYSSRGCGVPRRQLRPLHGVRHQNDDGVVVDVRRSLLESGARGPTAANKQLMLSYDKPMIYYSLSTLILVRAWEILIITRRSTKYSSQRLLVNAMQFGRRLCL